MRQYGLDEVQRTEEVGFEDPPPFGVVEFLDRTEESVAGIVDQHVDPAELADDGFDQWRYRGRVRDVEEAGMGAAGRQRLEVRPLRILPQGTHHGIAAIEQHAGDLEPETR